MGLPLANYHGRAEQKNPNCLFVLNWTDGGKLAKFPMRDFQCYVRLPMCRDQCSLHLGTQQKYIYNHINSNVYYLIICNYMYIYTHIYIYIFVCVLIMHY